MPDVTPVTVDQAHVELTEWLAVERPGVAELTGPAGSGRTGTLRRVHEAVPGSLFLDATGLTCEEIVERVMEAAGAGGFAEALERRSDWGYALEESPLGGSLIVIANAQRAGRTRSSAEPDRMVHRFSTDLCVAGRLKVLIERDLPDVRRRHDHLVVALRPGGDVGSEARPSVDTAAADALLALALAEPRLVPLDVWEQLRRSVAAHTGRRALADVSCLAAYVEVDTDARIACVARIARFRDERLPEALRRTAGPELVRAVNRDLVGWLSERARVAAAAETGIGTGTGTGTGTGGATARYLSQGLAMHAVQAGEFDAVQRSGRLVAHIEQAALLDAAEADDDHSLDGASPAGDAVNLWNSGVDSLSQDEWASWLHLMSTARGDHATAADIAASGRCLPWRVRWAHWRPPGALGAEYVRPGPLSEPAVAPADYLPGRYAVTASGQWDHRRRVWDAETGEDLAGPWPEEDGENGECSGIPTPGQREPLWLPDDERNLTPDWVDLTAYESLGAPLIAGQVTVGDVVVVTGLGGIFAVEAGAGPGSAPPSALSKVHGEPLFDDALRAPAVHTRASPQSCAPYADGLFEPDVVRRLPAPRLPLGITNAEARRFLTKVGLPAVECAEIQLLALNEQKLTAPSPDSLPDGAPPGTYFKLGLWVTSDIAMHGATGEVHLLNADDWVSGYEDEFDAYFDDEEDEDEGEDEKDEDGTGGLLIARSLDTFVRLLQRYLTVRCALASAGSRTEREEIRNELGYWLSEVDPAGSDSGAWRTGFTETD